MKFKASKTKLVATKLRKGVMLLMLIQIKRVCVSCEATEKVLTGWKLSASEEQLLFEQVTFLDLLCKVIFIKKINTRILVWAHGCGCCAAYPLG